MALPTGLDPAVVGKYGVAAAKRRAFRQQIGVGDVRKATARQRGMLRPEPDIHTLKFDLLPTHREMLAKLATLRASKRTPTGGKVGGPAGGKPYFNTGKPPYPGGPKSGRPVR